MDSDRVTKKLALFYHPLFQNTIIEWILSFNVNQTLMDMVTFMEINLRIQKIILPEFTFSSSLPSAATDWVREIETLSPGISTTNHPKEKDKTKQYNEIHKLIHEMVQEIPFDLANSPDKYIEFLIRTSQKNVCNYIADKISFSAFAKFLFDLCCSWCEYLDIEIFLFFLLGVLYQATVFQSADLLSTRPFEAITYLPEAFIIKVKWLKAQHKKKEYENFSYEDWYSFNYEPSRLQEAMQKTIESLSTIFKYESIPSHLEGLFEGSIAQIMKDGLSRPTKTHFEFLNKENNNMKEQSNNDTPLAKFSTTEKAKNQSQSCTNTYARMPKKTTIPIFGKALIKNQPEFSMRIHTILSINAFKDENDEHGTSTVPVGESPLCPIWEQEVSETGSEKSFRELESPEKSWVENDSRGFSNVQNGKTLEASYGSLLYNSKRFGSIREPKKMLDSLENSFIQEYQNNKDKVYQNRRELIAKSFRQNDQLGDEESFRIDNKISMILEDGTRQNEDKPISEAHRKKILANASLFDNLLANIHKDTKPLNTRNTNTSKATSEIKKEDSCFMRHNDSSEGIRGSSQGAYNRRWRPYSAYDEDTIDQNECVGCINEFNNTKKSVGDSVTEKGKKNNQVQLPQLGQKSFETKRRTQGYSQCLAQGYAVPELKNRKPILEQKGPRERKSNSVTKGEVQKNKSMQTDTKPRRRVTPQAMLDQWYGIIFDKMRQRHEDNRKHQEIRMKILKRPEDNQRGKAAEGKYNAKIGGPVDDRLVDDLLKESAR